MSKKNNKHTRRRAHLIEIKLEKKGVEDKQALREKKAAKLAAKGDIKKQRVKGIRGIKIHDSESKKKALKLIQAEALNKKMEVAAGVASLAALPNPKIKKKKISLGKALAKNTKKAAAKKALIAGDMEL
eukprot:gene14988-21046_t